MIGLGLGLLTEKRVLTVRNLNGVIILVESLRV